MPEPDPLPAIKTPWGSAPPPTGAGAGETPPIPIPDHTLVRRIGKGSYGEVWLARNVLGVYRAVKIIHRGSFDDDRPFEREFAGMQRFEPVSRSHESQLNILQVGRGPDCFYYVMELADDMGRGAAIDEASYTPRNLRSELLLRGRLPVDECVRLGLALTTALEHLHRHGLVHRDIKPSNIVFVNGIPKLADIGLVAQAECTMSFVGTEGYLPPEGPGTVQADLFSLGKVLYELSSGRDRQQFPELPTGITELPDRAALAEFNEVLLRACAPDVKQRYESAAEMHADLALLQSGKSVARMRAVERRLKFVARAGAAVTGIALLAGVAFFYQQLQTREARRLATENARLGEENRQRIVRLDIANGVRLLDANDPSAALLWFADALPLVTNNPAATEMHRIRIQQTVDQSPRLLRVMNHEASVVASAFSQDGLLLATATELASDGARLTAKLAMRDAQSGQVLWELQGRKVYGQLRFARDSRLLFVCSSTDQGSAAFPSQPSEFQLAEVHDVQSGKSIFPQLSSNLVCSAFSPDDRWLAVAFTNHVIQLLDMHSGQSVVELRGHTNDITTLAFSSDGSLLASGSRDFSVRLWRLPSGEPVGAPLLHDQPVLRVALSPDSRHLATTTCHDYYFVGNVFFDDKKESWVQVWEVQTAQRVGEVIHQIGPARALFFSPDGKVLFSGGEAEGVKIWDVGADVKLRQTLTLPRSVRCWAFSPDGQRFALGADTGFACVWSLETWDLLFPPFRHTGWVESVNFSPDGKQLLTTSDDGTAKSWSLGRNVEYAELKFSSKITPVSADKAHPRWRPPRPMPVALLDNALHLIDAEKMKELEVLRAQETNSTFMGWCASRSGRFWAMSENNNKFVEDLVAKSWTNAVVALWSREGTDLRRIAVRHPSCIIHLAFSPDESRLVTFCCDWKIRVWRTSDGGLERTITVPNSLWYLPEPILSEAFSPDGSALLLGYGSTAPENAHLQLFDLATGQLKGKPFTFSKISGGITQMRLSPDGTRFASVGEDHMGTIFDLQTGELAVPQFKHGGNLLDIDWSPDGRRLITAGTSPEVKMWDAATGELLLSPMTTGNSAARSARWSADGRFILTRSDDHTARVWDASTTEPVTPFLPHSGYIRWMCITPGNRLITASDPNLLRAWDLKPTTLPVDVITDYAKLLAGRKLNTGGVLLPIPAKELAELAQSLRARAPQLFE